MRPPLHVRRYIRSFFRSFQWIRMTWFSCRELLEFGAGDHVIVALAPGGAVVGMIDRDRLHFGVVVREVDDDFGEAGLQILDGVEVKVLPVRWVALEGSAMTTESRMTSLFGESRAVISGGVLGSMAARNGSLYS